MFAGATKACRNSYIRTSASIVGSRKTGRMAALISGEAPAEPKPGCLVCGKAQLHLTVNTHSMTLQQLLDKVGLVRGLGGGRSLDVEHGHTSCGWLGCLGVWQGAAASDSRHTQHDAAAVA